jgi:ERI1 exoribonuclease 3
MSGDRTGLLNHVKQDYAAFLVLDLEATCDKPVQPNPVEIIEFPVLVVNSSTFAIEGQFHSYVKPKIHPELSPFCVDLTGIIQDMVDKSPSFETVFKQFDHWVKNETGLMCPETERVLKPFTFVTCGNWDLQMMLPDECGRNKLRIPHYMRSYINLKKSFAEATGHWPKSFKTMLEQMSIQPVGRFHSGIDDCTNTVTLLKALADRGYKFRNTHRMW